jgi:hypothetical protein
MVAILDDSRELRYGSRALQRYLQKGMWDVQGWLHPNSADIIASMSAVQSHARSLHELFRQDRYVARS